MAHFQPNAPRSYAAACFSVLTVGHAIFFWNLDGYTYYLSAAAFDLVAIFLINSLHPLNRTAIWLQRVCFGMIIANAAGAIMWYKYWEPTFYNWSFVVLYSAALIVLIRKSPGDGTRSFRTDSWRACFRFRHLASLAFMRRIGPEIEE